MISKLADYFRSDGAPFEMHLQACAEPEEPESLKGMQEIGSQTIRGRKSTQSFSMLDLRANSAVKFRAEIVTVLPEL